MGQEMTWPWVVAWVVAVVVGAVGLLVMSWSDYDDTV